jgi:hypothetical protein
MGRKTIVLCHQIDHLGRAVHRLERADAKAHHRAAHEGPQQLDERRSRVQIPTVRSEMDAGKRDLLETRIDNAVDFGEHPAHRHASGLTSRRRDDAVGARLGTASLHAECERRAARHARLDRRATASVAIAEALGRGEAELGGQSRH